MNTSDKSAKVRFVELTPWFYFEEPVRAGYYDTQSKGWDSNFRPPIRLWWCADRRNWYTSPNSRNPLGGPRRWQGLAQRWAA